MVTAKTQISESEYFKMRFEDLEPEFVHGELIERSMPTSIHAWLTHLLSMRLHGAGFCLVGVRCQAARDVIRIPDIAVFQSFPQERLPTSPPFLVLEIISPDDRFYDVMRKLGEYWAWGVGHVWIVEPDIQRFHVYDSGSLLEVKQFELPALNIRIDAKELFAEAIAP